MKLKFNGKAFRSARKKKNQSQALVAELSGSSIRYVGALERGEKSNPSADLVSRFCVILDTPIDTLMTASDEE